MIMHRQVGQTRIPTAILVAVLLLAREPAAWPQNPPPPAGGTAPIKVDVDLIVLHVTVIDRNDRAQRDLRAGNFRVYDNGIEQALHHFSTEDLPYSMGLILDRSGSMMMMIDEVYDAAFHTIRASKLEDEFFVFTFNDEVQLRQNFSTDRGLLERRLKRARAEGRTALYDAIATGLEHVRNARHDKKALLVVTDGDDNSSAISFDALLSRAQQEEVTIFTIGMLGPEGEFSLRVQNESLRARLTRLAEATGGRAYFPRNIEECEKACIAIAEELRQQYSLGYYPVPAMHDGTWHAVEVRLQVPGQLGAKELAVRTRSGYLSPRPQEPNPKEAP